MAPIGCEKKEQDQQQTISWIKTISVTVVHVGNVVHVVNWKYIAYPGAAPFGSPGW